MARNKYDIDETLQTEFNFTHLKRLGAYIKPYRKELFITIFLMSISSVLVLFTPIFLMKIMDDYIPNKNIKAIILVSLLQLMIFLLISVILSFKISLTSKIGQNVIHKIRSDIFEHLQALPFSYYDDKPHGKIQVRVVNYVNSLSDLLSNGIVNTITDLFSLLFIIGFMLIVNVKLTLICLLGLPILIAMIF